MSSSIRFNKREGIATIELNRPEKYNSFTQAMAMEMQNALDDCNEDDSIRLVVLTGAGKAFCAGQDLKEATDDNGLDIEEIVTKHFNPIILKITQLNKPVLAAVNGVAAGAGANIALACDIVVAKSTASFIQAFSMIGLIPDSGGTYFLPRLIGHQKASAIMMLGDKISAAEAESLGMIYKCILDEEFDAYIEKLSKRISQMPTKGLALTKKAILLGRSNSLEQQLEIEKSLQKEASESHDYKEGTTAFLEKRKPIFKGK